MRDAQSKLDQVIAFTGDAVTVDDVATVLGLVGRDLLLDAVQAVADEDAPAAFALTARAVEMGYDLRAVCRELSRVVRDLLVLSVDPSRITDPEIAGEGERDRVKALAARFSREDLLRAFDVLTKAETDIRAAAQPRHHLEMALLRWIYLRKLVPIEDLIAGAGQARPTPRAEQAPPPRPTASPPPPPTRVGAELARPDLARPETSAAAPRSVKDALLNEIRRQKGSFYNMVVAQARTIELNDDRIVFTFSPSQKWLADQVGQNRAWLESIAQQASGRKFAVSGVVAEAAPPSGEAASKSASAEAMDKKSALREQALADAGVQTMLEVFPAEIRDVEEL
jgi:DNA polymerase III subunit gamma/tau